MKVGYALDVVLFERIPGEWVGQCLQYDIGAQASSLPELLYQLQRSFVGHVVVALENDLAPFECLPPAPEEYWGKWRQATITIRAETLPFRVPKQAGRVRSRLKIAA